MTLSKAALNALRQAAFTLHQESKSFRDIGFLLGVSSHRARQLVAEAESHEPKLRDWTTGLSAARATQLRLAGYTSKEEVIAGITEDPQRSRLPDLKCRKRGLNRHVSMIGPVAVKEIQAWADSAR